MSYICARDQLPVWLNHKLPRDLGSPSPWRHSRRKDSKASCGQPPLVIDVEQYPKVRHQFEGEGWKPMATYQYRIIARNAPEALEIPHTADHPNGAYVYRNRAAAIATAREFNRAARSKRLDPLNVKATYQIKPERIDNIPAQPPAVGVHSEGA